MIKHKEKRWVLVVFHSLMLFLFGVPLLFGLSVLSPITALSVLAVVLLIIIMNCYERIQNKRYDEESSLARGVDEIQDNTRTPME
jgi:uncharacterized membrane protein